MNTIQFETSIPLAPFQVRYYQLSNLVSQEDLTSDLKGTVLASIPLEIGKLDAYLYDGDALIGTATAYHDGTDAINSDTYALFQSRIEGNLTFKQISQANTAVLCGKLSKSGNLVSISSAGGSDNRITATTTPDGQRTAVTINV